MSYMDTIFFQFQGRIEGGANRIYFDIFYIVWKSPWHFQKKSSGVGGGGLWEGVALFK